MKLVSFGDLAAGAELIDHLGLALATYDGRTCGRLTMALEHLPPPVGPVANVATSNGAVFLWICATSPDPARTAAVTEVLTHFNWSTPTAVEEHVLEDSVPYGYNDRPLRMALLYRRTDLTRHEFGRHLLTRHAPLVLASGPMFKRYTVNIEPPQDCAWDGIVEQSFADMTDWNEHDRQVLEDKPEVLADIHRFIDHTVQFRARILRQYDVP